MMGGEPLSFENVGTRVSVRVAEHVCVSMFEYVGGGISIGSHECAVMILSVDVC